MAWRGRSALFGIPVLMLLGGCVGEPDPAVTAKTPTETCADLGDAVREFYDVASPNSTITELDHTQLPEVHGFVIPRPMCSFEVRPDPTVLPGDRFTIENFYLNYDEEITVLMKQRLEGAGFAQNDRQVLNWTATRLGTYYSANILVFLEGDGRAYTEAADGQVLDLTISQG